MVISDGQDVDAANSNPAWISATTDDTATGIYSLENTDAASGAFITNIQRVMNRLMDATGVDETTNDGTTYNAPALTIDNGDSHETALTKLADKFDPSTGHAHTGVNGDGPLIDAGTLDNRPLRASVLQGTDLVGVTGTSTDVSTELTGKSPSNNQTTIGVVVNAPENKVTLRQASGSEEDDQIVDSNGDMVFGRLTEAAGVWTLSFFVNQSGSEVAHNFSVGQDIRWYYQEIFDSLDGTAPVYSEFANIPSDNATADVIDATETLFGKVRLATNTDVNTDVVQSQDTRLPSQDENDALQGTNGTPSNTNRYVTNSDPRNTDSRDAISLNGIDIEDPLSPLDGQVLAYNQANNEFEAVDQSGGGGGAFSIITGDNSDFENTVGDWTNYENTVASAIPETGTGGSPTVVSIARDTTPANLLNGDAVGLISKTAADGQGEGVSLSDLDVPLFFRGKEMQIRFKYKTLSGYVNNFYRVFAYDQTNNKLLNVLNNNGGDGSLATTPTNGAEFTGSIVVPETAATVRLIIHATSTDATAFDVAIDDVKWEEITGVNGATITKEESFIPTGAWTTNATYTGNQKQVGASKKYQIKVDLSGAPDATGLLIDLPPGDVIDTSRLVDAARDAIGIGTIRDDTGENYLCRVRFNTSTTVAVIADDGDGTFSTVTNVIPITFANNDYVQVEFTVPIVGLEATALLNSSQANFQIIKAIYSVTGATANSSFADAAAETVDYDNKISDTHNAVTTGASWVFTAPRTGDYLIAGTAQWSGTANLNFALAKVRINSSVINDAFGRADSSVNIMAMSSMVVQLNEGDTLDIQYRQDDLVGNPRTIITAGNVNLISIVSLPDFTAFGVTGRPGLTINNDSPQVFTASGSYSKPDGLLGVVVEVVGGGGGGGGVPATVSTNAAGASGGGGGGYSKKFIAASDLSASETVTIGAGGAGVSGAAGNNGGTTSFGAHLQATGGTGGGLTASVNGTAQVDGRSGGIGSLGDINLGGGATDYGFASGGGGIGLGTGSAGGDAGGIGGGSGRGVARSGAATAGIAATSEGGGGGGAASGTDNNSAQAGGDGADGIVIVTELF